MLSRCFGHGGGEAETPPSPLFHPRSCKVPRTNRAGRCASRRWVTGCWKAPAGTAYPPSVTIPGAANKVPRIRNCHATDPPDGPTNCGTNARKEIAVSGFSPATAKPCRAIRDREWNCDDGSSALVSLPTSVRTSIRNRHAARAQLTLVNASADASADAQRPAVLARECTKQSQSPAGKDVTPTFQTWLTPRATMYATVGPGARNSTRDAPMKIARVGIGGDNKIT